MNPFPWHFDVKTKACKRDDIMHCPFFVEEYSGICVAHKLPYIPSISERKRYCYESDYNLCPNYIDDAARSIDADKGN